MTKRRSGIRTQAGVFVVVLLVAGVIATLALSSHDHHLARRAAAPGPTSSLGHQPASGTLGTTAAFSSLAPLASAGTSTCSVTGAGAAEAGSLVQTAAPGTVVCLAAGSYAGLDLSRARAGNVTLEPKPDATVTITPGVQDDHGNSVAVYFQPGTAHVVLHGFHVRGIVEVGNGSSFITVDHNDVTGGHYGVLLDSENCKTPNAPRWSGCTATPQISHVIISGNRIHDIGGPAGDDALNVNNYHDLRVTGNDLYGMREGGNHTDCLQSTFGGSGLIFDHNYEHDNQCQGFFVKDGDVSDATIYDNLFVRDQAEHLQESNIDVFNVYRLRVSRNTSLPGIVDVLRDDGSAQQPRATVDHNVLEEFGNGCCSDSGRAMLSEHDNIFVHPPLFFVPGPTDRAGLPQFVNAAADDYRLAANPGAIGVDWSPAGQHYGP